MTGDGDWNAGLVALTRLAELRSAAYADSARRPARRRSKRAEGNPFPENPGLTPEDVTPSLQAIVLERRRAVQGRFRRPGRHPGPAAVEAATTTATRGCSAGSARARRTRCSARFLSADSAEFKVRYLTLLSYFTDPALIPLLARVYAAPDSFGLPKRYAIRASDGLLWIGTRESMQALLDARAAARARGVYDDPSLRHADLDFLGSDSSSVISRTGKWLTAWVAELGEPAPSSSR